MALLLRAIFVAAMIWFVWRLLGPALGVDVGGILRRTPERPCATCEHRVNEFDDGVLCRFGRAETFKNDSHIANCHSWQRRGSA